MPTTTRYKVYAPQVPQPLQYPQPFPQPFPQGFETPAQGIAYTGNQPVRVRSRPSSSMFSIKAPQHWLLLTLSCVAMFVQLIGVSQIPGWINFINTVVATIYGYEYAVKYAERIANFIIPLPAGTLDYLQMLPKMTQVFTKKLNIAFSIVEAVLLFGTTLFFLWLFNTIVIQINIFFNCKKINGDTLHISAINALGGAISAAVIVTVWNILTTIPLPFTKILILIEGLPVIGAMIIPLLLLIFNLSFGAGLGNAVAQANACSSDANKSNANTTQK